MNSIELFFFYLFFLKVKRQAVIEIQRAVVAAESRAAEVMAQERMRMEKFLVEVSRHIGTEREVDNKSPPPNLAGTNHVRSSMQ